MCLSMDVLGGSTATEVLGAILGTLGLLGMVVNYFIYKKLLASGKKKYAADILRLVRETEAMED